MPSRKRSKGKERKARQVQTSLAKTQHTWGNWFEWGQINEKVRCNHGHCAKLPENELPVRRLLNYLLSKKNKVEPTKLVDELFDSFKAFPEVWKSKEHRGTVSGIMKSIATNLILHQVQFKSDMIDRILPLCSTIVILDAYEGGSLEPTFYHPRVLGKVTNFNGRTSVRRDMLKLLTKKNSCSCLKDLYAQARRTFPKLGSCQNCQQEKKRSTLMLCGYVHLSYLLLSQNCIDSLT